MNKKYVSETSVADYCQVIASEITTDKRNIRAIIAPVRGGLIPGVYMSHLLGVPLFPMNYSLRDYQSDLEIPTSFYHYMLNHIGNNVLLIDDIVDTGETYRGILAAFDRFDGVDITTAALIHNTDVTDVKVDYAGVNISRAEDEAWYEFFWEKQND